VIDGSACAVVRGRYLGGYSSDDGGPKLVFSSIQRFGWTGSGPTPSCPPRVPRGATRAWRDLLRTDLPWQASHPGVAEQHL